MKKTLVAIIILLSFYFISCRGNLNPVSIYIPHRTPGSCTSNELELSFQDTCSYNFVINFLSGFDSIKISSTLLGGTIYLLADSGDYNYWYNYFKNDSTIQFILSSSTNPDSLVLQMVLTGKKSIDEETQIFNQIKHLKVINTEETTKLVYLHVPEDFLLKWEEIFSQYPFITRVLIIAICTEF